MSLTMLRTFEDKVAPAHAALLVVDVQNDFCSSDGAFGRLGRDLHRVQEMVPRLKRVIEAARRVGATVIFARYAQTPATESDVHLEQRGRGRADIEYCQEGTEGAEFYEVAPQSDDPIVTKHRYSAFINTDLNLILRSKGIRTLVMTGVATNGCVEATARDGFMHDYYIVFVDDCAATYSNEQHQATLNNIRDAYGIVVDSEELCAVWTKGKTSY
jgi:ureidoacrylate peracid hydrolase